jgi:hypothetical protein
LDQIFPRFSHKGSMLGNAESSAESHPAPGSGFYSNLRVKQKSKTDSVLPLPPYSVFN